MGSLGEVNWTGNSPILIEILIKWTESQQGREYCTVEALILRDRKWLCRTSHFYRVETLLTRFKYFFELPSWTELENPN